MNLIIVVILTILFLFVFLLRSCIMANAFCHCKTEARIINLKEIDMHKMMQFYSLRYFYPEIFISYEVNGKNYKKKFVAKKLAKSEVNQLGDLRKDSEFPWRYLKVGDSINIKYMKFFPKVIRLKF